MGGNSSKIIIIIVALAAAAIIFYMTNRPEKVEQPKVEQIDLVCLDSGKHFTLAKDEYERRYKEAPAPEADSSGGPRRRGGDQRPKLISCAECDGGEALRAAKCPDKDVWYPIIEADGSQGRCPD